MTVVNLFEGGCLTATLAPPVGELIQRTIYPYAYIYDGDQESTTATFRTDPFVPSAWLADKFASKLDEEVRAQGGRPLEVKVYVDTTPLLWTDFRIEVSSTPIGGVAGVASGRAVGIPIWLAIILVCLAITAVIVVATLAIKTIVGLFKTKPGLDDMKPGWGKETLILTIQDSEISARLAFGFKLRSKETHCHECEATVSILWCGTICHRSTFPASRNVVVRSNLFIHPASPATALFPSSYLLLPSQYTHLPNPLQS